MDLSMKMDQRQLLTQQMIQTMNILQMNTLELEQYINEMALENPVIEIIEGGGREDGESDRELDLERKLNWLESTDRQNIVYYRNDEEEGNREANWRDIKDEGESLADYLKAQLLDKNYSRQERLVIDHIIGELDCDGYFKDDMDLAAAYLGIGTEELERMLLEVQKLDPAGVAARDLAECLCLQLAREPEDQGLVEDTERIIRDHLPLLARKHLAVIGRKLKLSDERVEECCRLIRSLNPRPGNYFNDRSHFHYISPDVIVVKLRDHFNVLINEYQYPAFQVNHYYENLAETTDDREAKNFLKEKIRQTRELASGVSYRISTLSRVACFLVERQKDFFVHGPGHKGPLQLSDIAGELDLHISTISRALSNKYLQCSWGIYPLNYFLVASAGFAGNHEYDTQEKIICKIEEIIEDEDKKRPLSDQKIAERLQEFGIEISRRTVSKYRGIKGIPDKSGRKQA